MRVCAAGLQGEGSTVTLKSFHPDPASRFTAPVPADFPAEMGVTAPRAAAFYLSTRCNSSKKSGGSILLTAEMDKSMHTI